MFDLHLFCVISRFVSGRMPYIKDLKALKTFYEFSMYLFR